MKILLLEFYDNNFLELGNITSKINKIYCDKYNHDLIIETEAALLDRHASWQVLAHTLKYFDKDYDYIAIIDGDAILKDDRDCLTELTTKYLEYDIIFSGDFKNNSKINAGFIIFKNNNYSKSFIELILSDNSDFAKKKFYARNWEQSVIWKHYKKNSIDIKNHSVIAPNIQNFNVTNIIPEAYIIHTISMYTYERRIKYFCDYLKNLQNK